MFSTQSHQEIISGRAARERIAGFSPERAAAAVRDDPDRACAIFLLCAVIQRHIPPERQKPIFRRQLRGGPFRGRSLSDIVQQADKQDLDKCISRVCTFCPTTARCDTHPENLLL